MTEAVLDRLQFGADAENCFKNYDVRGVVASELSYSLARRIGYAFAQVRDAKTVVVGRDCRLTSPAISAAVISGITSYGSDVINMGEVGTEEVYFATQHFKADAGAEITASHNPASYNGIKFVGVHARPLTNEDFLKMKSVTLDPGLMFRTGRAGVVTKEPPLDAYADFIAQGFKNQTKLKIVVDAGHGVAGRAFDAVLKASGDHGANLEVVRCNHKADGRFPNGVPNPLLPSKRMATSRAVLDAAADIGIAWDGDFDRCFFFDRSGAFVDGAYVAALIAEESLSRSPGETVLHDARVIWPMQHAAQRAGGIARVARTGHVHMKRAMRDTGAVYGGEISGHHYFREFKGCDSGMLPWLRLLSLLSERQAPLDELVAQYARMFPVSGERNYQAVDPLAAVSVLHAELAPQAKSVDRFDGVSLVFDGWRLNLRASSTEPLLRLNIEALGDRRLLADRLTRVDALLCSAAQCTRVGW